MGLFSFLTQELAIDLGTANTLIIHKDKVVVDEPSIIALERNTGNVIAIGRDAMLMYGKENEGIRTIRPLKDGVIADFQAGYLLNPSTNMKLFGNFIYRKFSPEVDTQNVFKENTTWFSVGLRSDLFNWYFDY